MEEPDETTLPTPEFSYTLSEQQLYGNSCIGLQQPDKTLYSEQEGAVTVPNNSFTLTIGDKRYELSNQLGNVLEQGKIIL